MAKEIGNVIAMLRQITPAEFQVSPGMMRLKPWEWGDLAPLRARLGADLQTAIPAAIRCAQSKLAGSTADEFRDALKPALDLVSPVGMDRQARGDWIKAAALMLAGVPHDLLVRGCRIAMASCDHPSKIVPAILRSVQTEWDERRRDLGQIQRLAEKAQQEPMIEAWQLDRPKMKPIELVEPEAAKRPPPREPTRADYLAMGMTALQLDEMEICA